MNFRSYARVVHGFPCPAHIRVWCDLLRRYPRLVITCPPEHAKTTWIGVMYPAFRLGRDPNLRIAIVCATERGAADRSRAIRATLRLPEYRAVFPNVRLLEPSSAIEWTIERDRVDDPNPSLFACGVGSASLVGRRVDLMILDDPMDEEAARSPAQREALAEWARRTMLTRITEGPESQGVCIMTRWHQGDLAAVLAEAGWYHLNQAASPDAPLWPERFGKDFLARRKQEMGSLLFACMYLGDPSALEGAIFRREWFEVVPKARLPRMVRVASGWDLAVSEATAADFTCKATVGFGEDGHFYVLDVWRTRAPWPTVKEQIRTQALMEAPHAIAIEATAFQLAAVQSLRSEGFPVPILADRPDRDKISRALEWQPKAEQGLVKIAEGPWNAEWLQEVCGFPKGQHDDQVDATSMAIRTASVPAFASSAVDFGDPLQAYAAGPPGKVNRGP